MQTCRSLTLANVAYFHISMTPLRKSLSKNSTVFTKFGLTRLAIYLENKLLLYSLFSVFINIMVDKVLITSCSNNVTKNDQIISKFSKNDDDKTKGFS